MGVALRSVPRTPLSAPLLGAVDVVFELDADLPLVGEVPDEGVLQQLLRAGPLAVALHQTHLDERLKLSRPGCTHTHTHTMTRWIAVVIPCTWYTIITLGSCSGCREGASVSIKKVKAYGDIFLKSLNIFKQGSRATFGAN